MRMSTDEDGPPLSIFIFVIALLFLSGFIWIFCCGTCVGRDAARACGLGRCVPKNDGGRRKTRRTGAIRTIDDVGQEAWEMLEEGLYVDDEIWNTVEEEEV